MRVYTKRRGEPPDFQQGIVLRGQTIVEQVCKLIHKDLINQFKFALVWGRSGKHTPQKVGLQHLLEDEDVIQIFKR